jgi:hypothetical protein
MTTKLSRKSRPDGPAWPTGKPSGIQRESNFNADISSELKEYRLAHTTLLGSSLRVNRDPPKSGILCPSPIFTTREKALLGAKSARKAFYNSSISMPYSLSVGAVPRQFLSLAFGFQSGGRL